VKPRVIKSSKEEEAFYQALCRTLGTEGRDIHSLRLLAITCQFVGALVANQDHRQWSPEAVMEVVATNIEDGNRRTVELMTRVAKPEGNA